MTHENGNFKPLRVGFITIGCRANQADSARMVSGMPENSIEVDPWTDSCDLVIINTCAVTARAEADARKLIRRAKRVNPGSKILVTGCAVQVESKKWSDMPEVDLVIGLRDRDEIKKYITKNMGDIEVEIGKPSGGVDGPTPLKGHRSRPFLKIQDGCTRGCAYCIVPIARGPERSRHPDLIRQDIHNLYNAGFQEIVLTGVHLGRWGIDLGMNLSGLLDLFDEIDLDIRFRLSSLEPMDLTPALVKRMIAHPLICPHLHIPLQSGDPKILDLMGRGHSLEHYTKLLDAALMTDPDTALGSDIMVGYPGEDDQSFLNTFNYLKDSPLTYLHIFTWSPRVGTRAVDIPNRPQGSIVKGHMKRLKELDRLKRSRFIESQIGKIRPCLVEHPPYRSGAITAISDNYIRVNLLSKNILNSVGQVIPFKIDTNNDFLD